MRFLSILLFCFTLVSCGQESTDTTQDTATSLANNGKTTPATATVPPEDIPRSSGCAYIPDEDILRVVAKDAATDTRISSQPGVTVSGCYYRLDNLRWSADFAIEVGDSGRADMILKQIKGASPKEKGTVEGYQAQFQSDNRILRVAAAPPFELKLSILPKAGYIEYADGAARKAMLLEFSKMLVNR